MWANTHNLNKAHSAGNILEFGWFRPIEKGISVPPEPEIRSCLKLISLLQIQSYSPSHSI